jgi:peptidoglycan/xylan/chitin deacetylase (PgdA/CDA1 family)
MWNRLRKTLRGPRPVILMYHRIADLRHDPWGMAVTPNHFAAQLNKFSRRRTVLSMAEFANLMKRGCLPRDAVGITFDDGYVDNLRYAQPALDQAGLPATLFLSTGPMRRGLPYWYEELSAMILDAPKAVEACIPLPEGDWIVRFGEREALDDERRGWRAWDEGRTQREENYRATWDRLRRLPPPANRNAMDILREQIGTPLNDDDRPMNSEEVAALLSSGHFTLGGHTLDHPDLLEMSDRDALEQIAYGKTEVEAICGEPIGGFAYPYGRYDARVRDLVGDAGFDWACTTQHGYVGTASDDIFALPRMAAEDSPDIDWTA